MKYFADLLDKWIGERNLDEVAPVLGVAISTVHSWRYGLSVPAGTKIHGLAIAMNVPEASLRKVVARGKRHGSDSYPIVSNTPAVTVQP